MQELSDSELDEAAEHLGYELQMAVAGALMFHNRNRDVYPPDIAEPTIDDALLEATLLHLRLLDEFLSGRATRDKHPLAVGAYDWLDGYSGYFLGDALEVVDAQVAHISLARVTSHAWNLPRLALLCCRRYDRFLQRIAIERPDRSSAFDRAREHVRHGLNRLPSCVAVADHGGSAALRHRDPTQRPPE
jgi:hypothetical protein